MFTGIIEDTGAVKSVEKKGASGRISIETALDLAPVSVGESIAVDGACLTVTRISPRDFSADVSEETLSRTTIGKLKKGDKVNLERPLTASKFLGGHIVTGHIDGTGAIKSIKEAGGYSDIEFAVLPEISRQIVKKGSIAIDGISLTVAGLTAQGFRVVLIPHTITRTTLINKGKGSLVNIETDIIAKYVERFLSGIPGAKKGITGEYLREHGF
ncbi:MAG: riboflavin synthase [Deltaproteobacteria bacterium]